jgi:hypothetical protein
VASFGIKILIQITGIVDENKEKKYVVGFIGDNTHATLPKQKLAKFLKEFKNFSKTKKKLLLESIKIAKDMLESKGKGEEEKEKIRKNIHIEKPVKRVKVKQMKKEESNAESSEEKPKPRRKLRRLVATNDKLLNYKRRRSDSIYRLT